MANFCIDNFDKLKILHNELDNKTVGLQNCIHIPSSKSDKSYSVSFFVSNLFCWQNKIVSYYQDLVLLCVHV